jgi:hypothetical protein
MVTDFKIPSDEWLNKVDYARLLLEDPGPSVVGELISIIRSMREERQELAELLEEAGDQVVEDAEYFVRYINAPTEYDRMIKFADRIRAWVERLRGGSSDG